jgi:hypothetical protein
MLVIKIEKKLALALLVIIPIVVIGLIFYKRSVSETPKKLTENIVSLKASPLPGRSYAEWIKLINKLDLNLGEGNFSEEYLEHEQAIRQYKTKSGKITIILCMVFAYQEAYMAVYSDAEDENHQALIFRQFINPSETFGTRIPLGLEYDEKTQIFTTFSKGRGAGDCGAMGKYLFNEETQSVRVVEFRIKECDDEMTGKDIDSWPLIFSAPDY